MHGSGKRSSSTTAWFKGFVTAQLAHDHGREGESREALLDALERAKAVVTRSLEELKSTGTGTGLDSDRLIRDTASHPADA